jgi:hypothetical protein
MTVSIVGVARADNDKGLAQYKDNYKYNAQRKGGGFKIFKKTAHVNTSS